MPSLSSKDIRERVKLCREIFCNSGSSIANYISSFLDFDGLFDPKRNFAVTNWSDEDITVNWRDPGPDGTGDNFYTLHAGEVKTYPMYLAYHITREFVDREMGRDATKVPNNPDGSYSKQRERLEMAVGNREARKPYEDKTMQEVIPGQESPEITRMRAEIRKKLIADGELSSQMNNNPDGSEKVEPQQEFATVPKKAGRPKKVA